MSKEIKLKVQILELHNTKPVANKQQQQHRIFGCQEEQFKNIQKTTNTQKLNVKNHCPFIEQSKSDKK